MSRVFWIAVVVVLGACAGSPEPEPVAPVAMAEPVAPAPRADVPERLTGELVRPVLAQMDGAVSGCYAIEYGGQQDTGGRVVIDWVIAPSGKVESASISESSFQNSTFESCVLEEAEGLEFPAARYATELSKPYLMRRDNAETATTGF